MKKEKSLSDFFAQARQAAPEVPLSDIKSLLESGKTSPLAAKPSFRPRRITQLFNPLKLIIMITPIVIITSVLLLLNPGNPTETISPDETKGVNNQAILKQENVGVHPLQTTNNRDQGVPVLSLQHPGKPEIGDTVVSIPQTLKLKPEVLKCLGIVISSDRIGYKISDRGMEMEQWIDSASPNTIKSTIDFPDTPDMSHQSMNIWADNRISFYPKPVNIDLMLLVQVDEPTASSFIQEVIISVYPDDHFFECLPPEIAEPLKKEFNYQNKRMDLNFVPQMGGSYGIMGGGLTEEERSLGHGIEISVEKKSGQDYNMGVPIRIPEQVKLKDTEVENAEPVPCVYFTNLCETLSGLDYANLYPNPVTDKLNVDLVLQKAKKIRYRVFDLGGKLISDEGVPENYPEGGRYTHPVEVSNLQPGFYLMVMTDEEGAKITRRFIKN